MWFAFGLLLGAFGSQYYSLVNDFPRTMNVRTVMVEAVASVPPPVALRLLALYEADVQRQAAWYQRRGLWQNELVQIQLRRYILHTKENHAELAESALVQAANMQKGGSPATTEEIEVLREVAIRAYGPK